MDEIKPTVIRAQIPLSSAGNSAEWIRGATWLMTTMAAKKTCRDRDGEAVRIPPKWTAVGNRKQCIIIVFSEDGRGKADKHENQR